MPFIMQNAAHIYNLTNLIFIAANVLVFSVLMYAPIRVIYKEKVGLGFFGLSTAFFGLYMLFFVDFVERLFYRTVLVNDYLIIIGTVLLFSALNLFAYGFDREFQVFILSEGLFMLLWFLAVQFVSIYLYRWFQIGSWLSLTVLVLAGAPIFIFLWRKLRLRVRPSRGLLISLTVGFSLLFLMANSTNIFIFGFKEDSLRVVISETFIGKGLFSGLASPVSYEYRPFDHQLRMIFVFCLLALLPVLFLIQTLIKKEVDNQLIHLKNQREEELISYIGMIESISKETRQLQHGIGNVLNSLSAYIYQDSVDIKGLRGYFEEINTSFGLRRITKIPKGQLAYLKNPEVLGLVLDKMMRAKELGVQLNLEIDDVIKYPEKGSVSIIRILAILLDNALEEAQNIEDSVVSLAFIKPSEDQLVALISNPTENVNFVDQFLNGTIRSNKGDQRGQGLQIVEGLIREHSNYNLDCKQEGQKVLFSFIVDVREE